MRLRLALSVVVALGGLVPIGGVASIAGALDVVPPDGPSGEPAVSADGRWVAFVSEASNLLGGDAAADTNGVSDVFLVDTESGTIRIVSRAGGVSADGPSVDPDISADGRYVVFETSATNLLPTDANGAATDIVRFDAQSGTLSLVSRRGVTGAQGDADSFGPTISADGTLVAFGSRATNLVGSDTNGRTDIFVRNVAAGTTTRVSTGSAGGQANNVSYESAISPNGTHVAFSSLASDLVSGDTNGARDVFLKNLGSGKTIRVSVTNSDRQSRGNSNLEDVSLSGREVVFSSSASNLVRNDDNGASDVFVRDRIDGTTARVSRRGTTEANGESFGASISDDGAFVVFQTRATNLAPEPDGNGVATDIFEFRQATKALVRISVDRDGGWPDGPSAEAAIAGAGQVIAFSSVASDLVDGDDDGVSGVFLHAWIDDARTERSVEWWSRALPVA